MNRAKAETTDALLQWIDSVNAECQRTRGNGHKILIFGKPSKNGVSVHFDFKKPERTRPSVNQIVRRHYAPLFPELQDVDFVFKPEQTVNDKDLNNGKMDIVKTVWHNLITLPTEDLIRGDFTPTSKDISLIDYVTALYEADRRLSEISNDKSQLLYHLKKSGLPSVNLCQIKEGFCNQFSEYLRDTSRSGLNYTSPFNVFQTFSHILNIAVRERKLKYNPCKSGSVVKPKLIFSPKTLVCLETEQLKQLSAYFESMPVPSRPIYGLLNYQFTHWESMRIFLFACATGLRISDIETLNYTDIEKIGGKYYFSSTIRKTKSPTRKKVSRKAMALIQLLDKRDDSPRVFSYVSRSALNNNIIRGAKNAGLTLKYRLSIHKARHTFASILALKGYSESRIQFELDHKTDKMTKHYIHVTQSMADDIDDAIDW